MLGDSDTFASSAPEYRRRVFFKTFNNMLQVIARIRLGLEQVTRFRRRDSKELLTKTGVDHV
jgi:hypothetical protein